MHIITEKVPDGKLVRIKVSFENNTIKTIQITGDFFVHPESAIEKLEQCLAGIDTQNIKKTLDEKIAQDKIEIIGFTSNDIARMIEQVKL